MTNQAEPLLVIDIGGTTVNTAWADDQLRRKKRFDTPASWPELLAKLTAVKASFALPFAGVAVSLPGVSIPWSGKFLGPAP